MPAQSPRRVLPRRPLILAALSALLAAATLARGAFKYLAKELRPD